MPKVSLDYPDTVHCFHCGDGGLAFGDSQCAHCEQFNLTFHVGDMLRMQAEMRIQDARQGGLVLGREGPEDDIPLLMSMGRNTFQLVGFMQGMEFLLSAAAGATHGDEIAAINSDSGDPSTLPPFELRPLCAVIDARKGAQFVDGWPHSGLWLDHRRQFVVNRYATRLHFNRLVEINSSA